MSALWFGYRLATFLGKTVVGFLHKILMWRKIRKKNIKRSDLRFCKKWKKKVADSWDSTIC